VDTLNILPLRDYGGCPQCPWLFHIDLIRMKENGYKDNKIYIGVNRKRCGQSGQGGQLRIDYFLLTIENCGGKGVEF
jgi:hypothetical protein